MAKKTTKTTKGFAGPARGDTVQAVCFWRGEPWFTQTNFAVRLQPSELTAACRGFSVEQMAAVNSGEGACLRDGDVSTPPPLGEAVLERIDAPVAVTWTRALIDDPQLGLVRLGALSNGAVVYAKCPLLDRIHAAHSVWAGVQWRGNGPKGVLAAYDISNTLVAALMPVDGMDAAAVLKPHHW